MDPTVFEDLCTIAREGAGINLKAGKEALVAARVAKRLRALGLPDEAAYLDYLRHDRTGEEITSFIDVISTNFTGFLREASHFALLSAWARQLGGGAQGRIRIWCAAAATGEEPYSVAVTLLDALGGAARDLRILATDISRAALEHAAAGRYDVRAVRPLSRGQLSRYFTEHRGEDGAPVYVVRPEVKSLVVFRRLNLARPPFPMKGPLDLVFCRNVMIYFGQATRRALVAEVERLLAPGGLLLTGHAETLTGVSGGLRVVHPSVYRKPRGAGRVARGAA